MVTHNSVELARFVAFAIRSIAGAEPFEVFCGLGDNVLE